MRSDQGFSVRYDVRWEMRDGVALRCDVYQPDGPGPFPVLLTRTPYNKAFETQVTPISHARWFARHGYLVVIQDVRGRWASEGEWYPFAHEEQDGYDTVEHAAALPTANGRVGMFGGSYGGATQWLAAVAAPPHLACISPAITAADYHDGWTYRGGALNQAFVQTWAFLLAQDRARRMGRPDLETACVEAYESVGTRFFDLPLNQLAPLREPGLAPWYLDWLAHPSRDAYWRRWSIRDRYARVTVPALNIGGWYDIFLDGTIANFVGMRRDGGSARARENQRLLIGPWHHGTHSEMVNGACFGPHARGGVVAEQQMRWWERWLRPDGAADVHGPGGADPAAADGAPVTVFCLGANAWREHAAWPPAGVVETAYLLRSEGHAMSLSGDGQLVPDSGERGGDPAQGVEPDHFTSNPRMPVRSAGGRSCCRETSTPMGPADQRGVEGGTAVLVYTSRPLDESIEVAGEVRVVLHASTTATDTDWTAKLVDVHPDGRAVNIADGIIRARYRDSLETPEPLEPERVYEYRIALGSTCALFERGHQVRLEIASANFPCYDRNPHTGGTFGAESIDQARVAHQSVHHDAAHPSRLILPILARGGRP
jgi:putative CocE/NonD family hydrolase